MKFLLAILFITAFSMAVANPETDNLRKFLNKFFKTIKGESWVLSDDCFGQSSEAIIQNIITSIQASDYLKALQLLNDLKNSISSNCPIQELEDISLAVTNAVANGTIAKNVISHVLDLTALISQESSKLSSLDAEEIGYFLGRLYKILVVGQAKKQLKFLSAKQTKFSLQGRGSDFLTGFIKATSSVPFENNQCFGKAKVFLPQLGDAIDALINAFINKSGIKEAFLNVMAYASKINEVETYCHFIALGTQFISIDGVVIIAKITARITKNLLTLVNHVKEGVKAFLKKDYTEAGSRVGAIFQIVFKYSNE